MDIIMDILIKKRLSNIIKSKNKFTELILNNIILV